MKENENSKEGSVELWGHIFTKKKLGLDEDEVVSFVNDLINERDKLSERQGHLTYLAELAEKTVAEADKIANRIKEESKSQAEAEAAARQMLRKSGGGELTTMGRDGKIRSKDTIAPARDPHPPTDTEH